MSDLSDEVELPLSMATLAERRKREVRMFKSLCIKLIMSDLTMTDYQYTLSSCQDVLTKFKEAVNTRLILTSDKEMNIITKLFKSVQATHLKRCLCNLIERVLKPEMIEGLSAEPVKQPTNLAEIFWLTYQRINLNYANLVINSEEKRSFAQNIVDDMEQFLIRTEQDAILHDLNII